MNVVTKHTARNVTQRASIGQVSATHKSYRVLTVTGIYPSEKRPHSGTFVKSQADSLLPLGITSEVIHPKPGPKPLRYISTAIQVFNKTKSEQYDIVHGHYGLWCLMARMQWKTPVVASFLGSDLLGVVTEKRKLSSTGKFVTAISRWLCHHVDAVIVKSDEMKQASRFQNSIVLPNGVDFALFHPIPRTEARVALGWHSRRYYILFGNDPNIPRKNFALAQDAVAILQEKQLDVKLIVASGLPQTQVALYINACNALILPSIAEGSPNIVKETMACNVPVVATDVGDVRQVIGHTDGCTVCSPDPEALAIALEKAILRTEPTTGREDIRHLDRTIIAQQVIAVYEQAIRNHNTHTRYTRKRIS